MRQLLVPGKYNISNLNSQVDGDQNDVAIAATPDNESTDSATNYGTPFP